ncbi:spondin domain-containing protein [Psychromonas arctica]|uniref:Spondin domain-containing protein n=1 Tax=Psychromonas arctica TaxID=168275 RepID=A0ABU9HF02_9GAMM
MIKFSKVAIATAAALTLVACGDNDSDSVTIIDTPVEYEVLLKNLTNGQPISAPLLILHDTGELFEVGEPASEALELLAESGDASRILDETSFLLSSASATGGIVYGETATVTVSHTAQVNYLSFTSMLGNSNDAFTGLNKVDLSELAVNDSLTFSTVAYDAGTEANTESAETVPGPAAGGEASNPIRDDINIVTMHPGIVSADDGLTTSALTYQQKFDNPVMSVTITRTR